MVALGGRGAAGQDAGQPPPDAPPAPPAQQPLPPAAEPAPQQRQGPRPGEWYFNAHARYTHTFETDFDDGSDSFSDDSFRLLLTAETLIERDLQLSLSLGYGLDLYEFDGSAGFGAADPWDDVMSLGFRGRVNWSVSNDWIIFGGADLMFWREDGADWDDAITGGGLVGVTYVFDEDLQIGGGLFVGSRLEDNALVVPAFVLNWNISENFAITTQGRAGLTGGSGVELIYYAGGRDSAWELAVGGRWDFRRFRLDEGGIAPEGVGEDVRTPIWLRLTWDINDDVSLDFYGGMTVSGEMELADQAGNVITTAEYDNAPFAGLSLRLKF